MRVYYFLSMLLAGLLPPGLSASEIAMDVGPALNLKQALDIAMLQNPRLQAIERGIGIAGGQVEQAGLYPNPEVSWNTEDFGKYAETTELVSQEILTAGKLGAQVGLASTTQDIARMEYQQQRNQLRADVIETFYAALLAQERIRIAEKSLKLAEQGLKVAEGQVRAGKSSPIESRRIQIQLSQVQLTMNQAGSEKIMAFRALAALLGQPVPEFAQVVGDVYILPPLPDEGLLTSSLDDTLTMQLATRQVEQSQASVELEKARRIPNVTVSLGHKRLEETNRDQVVLGVSMPIPLFNRNQGNLQSALSRVSQSQDYQRATEVDLHARTQQALAQWQAALRSANSLSAQIIPSAQVTLDNLTRGFQAGKFEFLDVLDAQRSLLSLRTEYVQAALRVTGAWAEIARIYGGQIGTATP